MTTDKTSATAVGGSALSEELGPNAQAVERWYCVSREGMATLCVDEEDARANAAHCDHAWRASSPHRALRLVNAAQAETLREALTELRDRIKAHPAYADLTEEEEMETGGDTAELSYLARVADAALGA